MQIALDNYHSMSAKTRAAGMPVRTSLRCTDKCASTKVVSTTQGECRTTELAWLYDRTAGVTRSVNTLCIDAFGIRFGASGLDSERVHCRDPRLERSWPSLSDDCCKSRIQRQSLLCHCLRLGNRTLVHYCDALLTIS